MTDSPQRQPNEWAHRSAYAAVVEHLTKKPAHIDPRQIDLFALASPVVREVKSVEQLALFNE
jgi:hypothetical protein